MQKPIQCLDLGRKCSPVSQGVVSELESGGRYPLAFSGQIRLLKVFGSKLSGGTELQLMTCPVRSGKADLALCESNEFLLKDSVDHPRALWPGEFGAALLNLQNKVSVQNYSDPLSIHLRRYKRCAQSRKEIDEMLNRKSYSRLRIPSRLSYIWKPDRLLAWWLTRNFIGIQAQQAPFDLKVAALSIATESQFETFYREVLAEMTDSAQILSVFRYLIERMATGERSKVFLRQVDKAVPLHKPQVRFWLARLLSEADGATSGALLNAFKQNQSILSPGLQAILQGLDKPESRLPEVRASWG